LISYTSIVASAASGGELTLIEIKAFVQKIGTNHQLLDKSASFSFSAPWDYAALRKAQSHQAEPRSGGATSPKNRESIIWLPI